MATKFDISLIDDPKALKEKVVAINRVSKTVKGGRIMKFSALVVVGDGNGIVGFGLGKAGEVPDAIRKGIEDAKKNLIKVSLKGTTIPHEVIGVYGKSRVKLLPSKQGNGIIAGVSVRPVVELCGITGNGGEKNYLPFDRDIDGVSIVPLLKKDKVIHTEDHPILHMKREDIKGIQYTVTTESVLSREEYKDYTYPVLLENDTITFKYFDKLQNDNSAFWDKNRKNWLHILTDDYGENYNRTPVYPTISDEMHEKLDEVQKNFKDNRRGIIE